VPADRVKRFAVVIALPNVHPPPTPLKIIGGAKLTPFVVTVLPVDVEEKVIVPVLVQSVPDNSDSDPRMFSVGDVPVANVTVPADTVMSRHARAPVIVTV
jgi:hypothetical protein